jgi:hypothetical protein
MVRNYTRRFNPLAQPQPDTEIAPIYSLVAAVIERARMDLAPPLGKQSIRLTCEATGHEHPARDCAREFLNYLDSLREVFGKVSTSEFALEVLHYGDLRGTASNFLFTGESPKARPKKRPIHARGVSG